MIAFNRPTISKKDLVNVLESMLEDKLIEGELTKKFELAFASYLGIKDSVLVNSEGAALYLILKHLGLESGEEVILSAYTDAVLVEVILALKLKPVLVDVEKKSFLLDKNDLLAKKSPKTRVIIISHGLGYIFPMNSLSDVDLKGVSIIEDCRESLGSTLNNIPTGMMGDYAFFSFNPNRIITMGYGGSIIAKNKRHLAEIKDLRDYINQDNLKGRLSFSSTEMQAAMGLSELSLIKKFIDRRQEIGNFYLEAVCRGKNSFFNYGENVFFNYGTFPIIIHSPLKITKEMFKKYKVEVIEPIKNPIYQMLGLSGEDFPNALQRHLKTLLVPIYPRLEKPDIEANGKLITNIS